MDAYGLVHRIDKGYPAILALGLGPIQRNVCISQQFPRRGPFSFGDPNTCRHMKGHVAGRYFKRRCQNVANSFGDHLAAQY